MLLTSTLRLPTQSKMSVLDGLDELDEVGKALEGVRTLLAKPPNCHDILRAYEVQCKYLWSKCVSSSASGLVVLEANMDCVADLIHLMETMCELDIAPVKKTLQGILRAELPVISCSNKHFINVATDEILVKGLAYCYDNVTSQLAPRLLRLIDEYGIMPRKWSPEEFVAKLDTLKSHQELIIEEASDDELVYALEYHDQLLFQLRGNLDLDPTRMPERLPTIFSLKTLQLLGKDKSMFVAAARRELDRAKNVYAPALIAQSEEMIKSNCVS
jgi:hypothetical protein